MFVVLAFVLSGCGEDGEKHGTPSELSEDANAGGDAARDARVDPAGATKTFIHLPHRVIADEADTHVYYDLTDRAEGTQLEMTIVIQMRSLTTKWLALATGSAGLWRRHQREELGALRQLVESEPTLAPIPASA